MIFIIRIVCFLEVMIYHAVLMLMAGRVFRAVGNKTRLILSTAAVLISALLIGLFAQDGVFRMLIYLCPILSLLSLWQSFSGVRLSTLVMTYAALTTVCVIAVSTALMIFPDEQNIELTFELIVHIVLLILCIIISCTSLRTSLKYMIDWTPLSTKWILLLLLICNALLSLAIQRLSFYNSPVLLNGTKFVFMLLIVTHGMIVSGLLLYSVTNKRVKKDAALYEKQLQNQLVYYQKLSESNFALRQYRHDSKNICICLEELLTQGRTDEALVIIRQQLGKTSSVIKGYDTGNGIADGLISDKAELAAKYNTEIVFEGALPTQSIQPTDLCVILGNTLDNAIEACSELKNDEKKTIHIKCQCGSGYLFLQISNPVAQKVILQNGIPYTTKANKKEHGFGLFSLGEAIKKYHGAVMCKSSDQEFCITITLELLQNAT